LSDFDTTMKKKRAAFVQKIQAFQKNERQQILAALETADAAGDCGAAALLLELGADSHTVVAALLLEAFPDKPLPESLHGQFGADSAGIAEGVKRIDAIRTNNGSLAEAQNIRNMIFALTDDIRVLLIKLAQKMNAMRVLDAVASASASGGGTAGGGSAEKERKLAAKECLDIFAPLANRLGISWLKNEMEDLSLKFLNRDTYQQIKNLIQEKRGQRSQFLDFAQKSIKAEAAALGFNVEVKSRAKHFYSVYMKMRKRGKSENEILDLFAMRIVCDTVENCYTLLGVVHRLWEPVSGCFDDYVAKPKPNGYQSLHTTVMVTSSSLEAKPLEVQIRTAEMHDIAENGIASHLIYKKGSSKDTVQPGEVGAVNQLKNWKQGEGQKSHNLSAAWLEGIKREILGKWIYVFTPQGKVIKLKAGSTPIDFAYHIHSAVGERCMGAKANGSIIQLSSQLKSTQTVEILTNSSAHPRASWLELVKSQKVRSKIRAWLEKHDPTFSIEKAVEKKKAEAEQAPAAKPQTVAPPVATLELPIQKTLSPHSSALRVRIENEKNMLVSFARCCNPVTGDLINGYISRGRGIIIHRRDCPSLTQNPEYESRKIDAQWESSGSALVKRFRLEAKFTANLFSEIEGAIRRCQGHLTEGRLEETPDRRLTGFFTIQLANETDLKTAMKNIRGIPGVINIQLC